MSRREPPEMPGLPEPGWPEPLSPAAFHGLAGEVVQAIGPHTEADLAALLVQFLVAFGSAVGAGPHFMAEADAHHANMFVAIVGTSAKGRKGTSWGYISSIFKIADEEWSASRVVSGLSSGEGLIWAVRDPIEKQEPIRAGGKRTGEVTGYQTVVDDPGVEDKRLLVQEGELASVLRVLGRDGNTLSPLLRQAWDCGHLRTLTKNSPAVATGAHVSIVGHITRDELRRYLDSTEAANGFANRFMWICTRRSKLLPEGGDLAGATVERLGREVGCALTEARRIAELRRDDEARRQWIAVYPELSAEVPGLLGAVTARAEPTTMRLALIYALLDGAREIRAEHLAAGLAVWRYAFASARYIFGDATGDPVADAIFAAARSAPGGATRTDISARLSRHVQAARLDTAIATLIGRGQLVEVKERTGGRPAVRYRVPGREKCERSERSPEAGGVPSLTSLSSHSDAKPTGAPGEPCPKCGATMAAPGVPGCVCNVATADDDAGDVLR